MNQERKDLFNEYLKIGISPLLVKNFPADNFNNSVVIKANVDVSELNGHYEGLDFCPPEWYKKLLEESKNTYCILVIEDINEIPLQDQPKFGEILKYRKISTFKLPKNCLVIVTCSNLEKNKICEEVYTLLTEI